MSHYIRKTGIRIKTDRAISTAADVGLYSVVGGNSEFRWVEATLSGVSDSWKAGLLLKDFITDITQKADFRRGGAPVQSDGCTITVSNINQLSLFVMEQLIQFPGLQVEVVEFVGTESDSDSVEIASVYSGVCEDVQWTETELKISVKNSRFKRRSNLMQSPESQDKVVPVTFGQLDYAKFNRNSDAETIFSLQATNALNSSPAITFETVGNDSILGINSFPIVGNAGGSPILTYYIQIIDDLTTYIWKKDGVLFDWGTPKSLDYFVGKWVRVTGGSAAPSEVRAITAAEIKDEPHGRVVSITINYNFSETLIGNAAAGAVGNSWVEIVDIPHIYSGDNWELKGPVDLDGVNLTKSAFVYSYDSDAKTYNQLSANFSGSTVSADKTEITLAPRMITTDSSKVQAFTVLPVKNLEYSDLSTVWESGLYESSVSYPGLLIGSGYDSANKPTYTSSGGPSVAIDRTLSTVWQTTLHVPHVSSMDYDHKAFALRFEFDRPDIPDTFEFEKAYIGINLRATQAPVLFQMELKAMWRRFMGPINPIFSSAISNDASPLTSGTVADIDVINLPSGYYVSGDTTDDNFDTERTKVSQGGYDYLSSGYTLMEIPEIVDAKSYNQLYRMCLQFKSYCAVWETDMSIGLKLYELAIIFQHKESDLTKSLYSPYKGRIYNSTWGSRKTSANMIDNPIDILEHTKRLQNWSELGENKLWGQEYATSPLINTTSFDSASLDDVKALRPARQFLSYDKAWTDTITQSLCSDFYLCSYQDKDGKECVSYLHEPEPSLQEITIRDIIGEVGDVIEPNPQDIFCGPSISYAFDYGSDKFSKQLIVKPESIGKPTFDESYVIGFESGDTTAQQIWEACNDLYAKYRRVETMPSIMAEKPWITTYEDAVWCMQKMIAWMDKLRTSFTVSYEMGRDWYVSKHIGLKLVHQTSNFTVECILEEVRKSKKNNKVFVKLLLLDPIPVLNNGRYQDTYTPVADSLRVWQDDYDSTNKKQDNY